MKPRHWCCIILLCLWAAFSARAQSPALKAVEYERILFQGARAAEANDALLSRALCLVDLGRWADASDALDRLRLYALEPSVLLEANYLKALCKYRQGDHEGASALAREGLPDTPEAKKLGILLEAATVSFRPRSELTAALLGIVPPAGHLYTNAPGAIPTTLATAGSVALWVLAAVSGDWVTAILGGGLLLSETWWRGSVQAMPVRAREYNEKELEKFLKEQESLLDF